MFSRKAAFNLPPINSTPADPSSARLAPASDCLPLFCSLSQNFGYKALKHPLLSHHTSEDMSSPSSQQKRCSCLSHYCQRYSRKFAVSVVPAHCPCLFPQLGACLSLGFFQPSDFSGPQSSFVFPGWVQTLHESYQPLLELT